MLFFHERKTLPEDSARNAASAFEKACRGGHLEAFNQALDQLGDFENAWDLAMDQVADLADIIPDIQIAFLNKWAKYNWLSSRARYYRTVDKALRILLPKSNYDGSPAHLFRGARAYEGNRYGYGLSWTTRFEIARKFAESHDGWIDGSVVFETVAAPSAVLYRRKYRHYILDTIKEFGGDGDDDEYIVDPTMLPHVRVAERLRPFICTTFMRHK